MQYNSPLHILVNKEPSEITASNLKNWQEEILQKLAENQSSTLIIEDKTYDKTQLQAALDLLATDPDFHLRLFNNKPLLAFRLFDNKPLLAFIENGDTTVFKEQGRIKELSDPDFRAKIKPYFVSRFSELLYQCVVQPGFQSIGILKDIRESYFKMPDEFAEEAYAKTYAYLDRMVNEGAEILENPFIEDKNKGLKKEAVDFFHNHKLNVFLNLPEYFSAISTKYAVVAHNYIVKVLRRNPHPEQASRPVARVMLNACRIDAALRNDPQSKQLVKSFDWIMNQKEVPTKKFGISNQWTGWRGFLLLAFFVCFFGLFGQMPQQCTKRDEYSEATKRYNYYVKKSRQGRTVKEQPVVAKGNLQGAWRSDLFWQKVRIFRTFHFYSPNVGKSVFQFVTTHGEEKARITAWFNWEVDDSRRRSQVNLLKTRHIQPFLVEGDLSALSEQELSVFNFFKNRVDYEVFEEVIEFTGEQDYFLLGDRKFYQEEAYDDLEDLPQNIQDKLLEIEQYNYNLARISDQIAASYEQDSVFSRGIAPEFTFSPLSRQLIYNKYDQLGTIETTDTTAYFFPNNWTTGKNYQLLGTFKNIQYYRNNEVKTGNLEILRHYRTGIRFREQGEISE